MCFLPGMKMSIIKPVFTYCRPIVYHVFPSRCIQRIFHTKSTRRQAKEYRMSECVGAGSWVDNALYYKSIDTKWQMLARYSKSPALTETEKVMTKFCGDTRGKVYEYVHEFLL
jgi:hypothetical protein